MERSPVHSETGSNEVEQGEDEVQNENSPIGTIQSSNFRTNLPLQDLDAVLNRLEALSSNNFGLNHPAAGPIHNGQEGGVYGVTMSSGAHPYRRHTASSEYFTPSTIHASEAQTNQDAGHFTPLQQVSAMHLLVTVGTSMHANGSNTPGDYRNELQYVHANGGHTALTQHFTAATTHVSEAQMNQDAEYIFYQPQGSVVLLGLRVGTSMHLNGSNITGDNRYFTMYQGMVPPTPITFFGRTAQGVRGHFVRPVLDPRAVSRRMVTFADFAGLPDAWSIYATLYRETLAGNNLLNPDVVRHIVGIPNESRVQTTRSTSTNRNDTTRCLFCRRELLNDTPFARRFCGHYFHWFCFFAQNFDMQQSGQLCYFCDLGNT